MFRSKIFLIIITSISMSCTSLPKVDKTYENALDIEKNSSRSLVLQKLGKPDLEGKKGNSLVHIYAIDTKNSGIYECRDLVVEYNQHENVEDIYFSKINSSKRCQKYKNNEKAIMAFAVGAAVMGAALSQKNKNYYTIPNTQSYSSQRTYASSSYVWVNGYYKSDGTWVNGHYRSKANSTKCDNWSTKGNYNPFTYKKGTKNLYGC